MLEQVKLFLACDNNLHLLEIHFSAQVPLTGALISVAEKIARFKVLIILLKILRKQICDDYISPLVPPSVLLFSLLAVQ